MNLHQILRKLEWSSTETIRMIQKAFRDDAMSAMQIEVGTNVLKMVKGLLKVTHALEGLQQEHLRMFNSAPLQPRFGTCDFWLFPKLKSPFKRQEISDHQ